MVEITLEILENKQLKDVSKDELLDYLKQKYDCTLADNSAKQYVSLEKNHILVKYPKETRLYSLEDAKKIYYDLLCNLRRKLHLFWCESNGLWRN